MKAKITILALVFITGCAEQQIIKPCKIKVKQMNCNNPGSGAYITETLKQELQKKGYNITEDSPDIVISGAISVSGYEAYITPQVTTSVIYISDGNNLKKYTITHSGDWWIKSPKAYSKIAAKEISEKLQKSP
jgi:hypothetical protein